MIDLPNLTPITHSQRQTLARVLNTVANGGGTSHSIGGVGGAPSTAFHDLLETLVDSGLLRRKEHTIHDAKHTGTLVLNYGAKDEISALADAAGSTLGDLRSELAALTSNDAVTARLDEIAFREEAASLARQGILHPDIPAPPGYDRTGNFLGEPGSQQQAASAAASALGTGLGTTPSETNDQPLPSTAESFEITLQALRDAVADLPTVRQQQAAQAFANAVPDLRALILSDFALPADLFDNAGENQDDEAA